MPHESEGGMVLGRFVVPGVLLLYATNVAAAMLPLHTLLWLAERGWWLRISRLVLECALISFAAIIVLGLYTNARYPRIRALLLWIIILLQAVRIAIGSIIMVPPWHMRNSLIDIGEIATGASTALIAAGLFRWTVCSLRTSLSQISMWAMGQCVSYSAMLTALVIIGISVSALAPYVGVPELPVLVFHVVLVGLPILLVMTGIGVRWITPQLCACFREQRGLCACGYPWADGFEKCPECGAGRPRSDSM